MPLGRRFIAGALACRGGFGFGCILVLAPPDLPAAGLAPDLAGVNFALFAPVAGDSLAASSLRQSALRTVALLPEGILSVLEAKAFVLFAGFDATPAALGALDF